MTDDLLLTPTLTAEDDAVDFDHPWNPWSLVVLTFFVGLFAGGPLLALNAERLGLRRRFWLVAAVSGLAGLALVAGPVWALDAGIVPDNPEARRIAGWVTRGLGTLVAILLALPQVKRWRLFQASGLPGGHLFWWGIGAAVAGTITTLLLAAGLLVLFSVL